MPHLICFAAAAAAAAADAADDSAAAVVACALGDLVLSAARSEGFVFAHCSATRLGSVHIDEVECVERCRSSTGSSSIGIRLSMLVTSCDQTSHTGSRISKTDA